MEINTGDVYRIRVMFVSGYAPEKSDLHMISGNVVMGFSDEKREKNVFR